MKRIILALVLAFGMAAAYADNTFPTITPGSADTPTESEIVPPGVATESPKEMDYSKNPVVVFIASEWVQIGSDPNEKETYWLNVKSIDPEAENFMIVGMIDYGKDRIIQGVGTNVRRIFSEGIVECTRRIIYPFRDIYTTVDFHIVSLYRHSMPQGAMLLDDVPIFKMYPDAKAQICPKK
jgi:hypothetical protein